MNNGIKRFITCHIPVSACNFKCKYCYIAQLKYNNNKIVKFVVSPREVAMKLSPMKLGGICYFNLCGDGETMLHPELIDLVDELTKYGHIVDIITNGTITSRFDELTNRINDDQKKRLFIKFSFHYDELIRTNMMNTFLENIDKIKNNGISYSIEITPYDELIPRIPEIKDFSLSHFGALPHVTVARNEATNNIELLTHLTRDEYVRTWGQFQSPLFDFKSSIFNVKRCEFCYAGDWSLEIHLASGIIKQCYRGQKIGNLKECDDIDFTPIGMCTMPHCFNGHAFLAFGDIPELTAPTYYDERNRQTIDGCNWIVGECQFFFKTKLYDNNAILNENEKKRILKKNRILKLKNAFKSGKKHLLQIVRNKR